MNSPICLRKVMRKARRSRNRALDPNIKSIPRRNINNIMVLMSRLSPQHLVEEGNNPVENANILKILILINTREAYLRKNCALVKTKAFRRRDHPKMMNSSNFNKTERAFSQIAACN